MMQRLMPQFIRARMPTAIQWAGRLFGFEVRANNEYARDDLRLVHLLRQRGVDLVYDVGANRGQFARSLFDAGYDGEIASFEAVPEAHSELTKRALNHSRRWTIAPIGALSDRNGEVEFHINVGDTTSSLLAASSESLESIAELKPASVVRVASRRLDDVALDHNAFDRQTFLKLDVQGGEALVLAGGPKLLSHVVGLVIELSFAEIYDGQPLAFDVLKPLLDDGFIVHDIYAAYRDPKTFRLMQADFVLLRDTTTGPKS